MVTSTEQSDTVPGLREPESSRSTPVALTIFNRPVETARVFEAIRAQRPSRLLIVGDGARGDHPGEADLVSACRSVVSKVDWPCQVSYNYAETNMGCGARVSSGLDWVFSNVDEAVVLEDDCLPAPAFFRFAAMMLDRYRHDERLGMVAGTNYFSDASRDESYFLTNYCAIWGWATWARAWRGYDRSMPAWPEMRQRDALRGMFRNAGLARYMRDMLDAGYREEVDTWDIQWTYHCLRERRLCIVPRVNLVTNIGYVGTRPSGSDLSIPADDLDTALMKSPSDMLPDFAYEDRLFREKLRAPMVPTARDRFLRLASRIRARVARAPSSASIPQA